MNTRVGLPYSSDLNSIEHVWPMLKAAALQRDYLNIASMREGSRAVKEKMTEILPEVWRSLCPKVVSDTLC
jgi:transposase